MVFKNLWLVVSTYPSEKWWSESQLGWFFHSQLNDLNGNKKGSKLPTRPKYRPNLGVFPAIRGYPSPLGSLESSGASSTPWPIPLRLNDIKWLNKTMITDVYCKKNTIQYCIYIYTYTHIYIYIPWQLGCFIFNNEFKQRFRQASASSGAPQRQRVTPPTVTSAQRVRAIHWVHQETLGPMSFKPLSRIHSWELETGDIFVGKGWYIYIYIYM